ncbi:DNA processing protein [Dysgonomonas sp. PH5-45]|uniref:DNA-processing protein DprA n=1 Tax=unclassified Dysgonomonas TaxID=2630389 RepID=UPI002474D64C|nr:MULTISPECIES: DNA-processing protein DprA [unclassified Dysgonomonas]MDH6354197.1 DNA processing protein [Dysgonomonas sp. PH5-45]MDH6387098.1 DNA processing protein [Dysgonomonas sp. PH5-37]
MTTDSKKLYQIALTLIKGVGCITARQLMEVVGDEEAIFKSTRKSLLSIRGVGKGMVDEILNPSVLLRAEKELEFVEKNKIRTYFYTQTDYPERLKHCIDAPSMLYYKGNADLDAKKTISIVGTRKSTAYGNSFTERFVEEVAQSFPDVLIVSGLAYGIDIQAHRAALKNSLSTVGVLAHGLDRIYPSVHRKTAVDMLGNGGLLTEFTSETEPERFNFVRRNRIIAGLADAVVVVESDKKGGSLITADIANSYNREVFALPGRVSDASSLGCNRLIQENKAILLQSADDLIKAMNWDLKTKKQVERQPQLFQNLSAEEQRIHDLLLQEDAMHVNSLSDLSGISLPVLLPTLLEMEMKNIIEPLPGGMYRLK